MKKLNKSVLDIGFLTAICVGFLGAVWSTNHLFEAFLLAGLLGFTIKYPELRGQYRPPVKSGEADNQNSKAGWVFGFVGILATIAVGLGLFTKYFFAAADSGPTAARYIATILFIFAVCVSIVARIVYRR